MAPVDLTNVAVAISTTAHEHRLSFLETTVARWLSLLPPQNVVITVDGDADEIEAVRWRFAHAVQVIACGLRPGSDAHQRQGVAVNKNTGIEALMDLDVEHMFLCDDDTRPRTLSSLLLHTQHTLGHTMVSWGQSRLGRVGADYASWSWPRGCLLYTRRHIVEEVGGMDERFGIGGHEHVEWSRRIHQRGFTPEPYISPLAYASHKAQGARVFWDCEDQIKPGEWLAQLQRRRDSITSVDKSLRDWDQIHAVMAERDGDPSFVPYRAAENQRSSATLYQTQEEN